MAVQAGSSTPSAYKMGASTVAAVYCGSTKVWPVVTVAGAPTGVTGTAGNAQVSLSWTAPSSNGGASITDYTIQYSSNSGSTWTTFSHTASTAATATVTGLTNGTAYVFHVAAVNSAGTSSYSTTSSSVTPASSGGSLLSIARNNGTSTFSGSGTTASPYTRSTGLNLDATDGLSHYTWTASGSATASVTFNYSDDDGSGFTARIYKNGSQVGANISDGTVTRTFSVVSGDAITIGVPGSPPSATQYFSGVSVSAA
jgi:hypothetical protein